jgi:hypothetical protein
VITKQLQPIWFRLPKRFYTKLDALAGSIGWAPEDALQFAVDLLGRYVVLADRDQIGTKEFSSRIVAVLQRQQKSAYAHEVKVVEALQDAVKLFEIYGPLSTLVPRYGDVNSARNTPSALSALYWAKISPQERSRRAREMARKRWDAKKGKLPKAVGENSEG